MVNLSKEAMLAFNQELIQCIEELKSTKSSLEEQIVAEETEKSRLQHEVERMNVRISQLNESLGKKSAARTDYERTIQETESAYMKILESSQLLLNMVKREAACLDQTLSSSSSNSSSSKSNPETARRKHSREAVNCLDDNVTCSKPMATADHARRKKTSDIAIKM
ncbi:Sjoegren syndrome nuclear autoantigen 1 homolog [Nasonia vitripennis]|uniref:Uncharacterized protein n=1 Tax=Nasonia vitripennis TaxID=7425 RepID=A0A7M7H0R5_NASVI|nr:Sjoegren syndrome nuclear autoantigen 1 homolog [Nasonia vitripennis]